MQETKKYISVRLKTRDGIPIILCSGYVYKNLEEEYCAVGIITLLKKPIKTYELAKAIQSVLIAQ
jgi:hypothetical protein